MKALCGGLIPCVKLEVDFIVVEAHHHELLIRSQQNFFFMGLITKPLQVSAFIVGTSPPRNKMNEAYFRSLNRVG